MSTFSCHTGRYCSTAGDVIIFKVDPDNIDDNATIKTEVNSTPSLGGQTVQSEKTQNSVPISQIATPTERSTSHRSHIPLSTFSENSSDAPSTLSTQSAPTAASTVPVNIDGDDNYNILLRRKDDGPIYPSTSHLVQTGKR